MDRGTQDDILTRITDRIRVKVPELAGDACFLCDQPQPSVWPIGDVCCTVSIGPARYPEPFYVGGGPSTLAKSMTVDVTVWIRCQLDSVPSCESVLVNDHGLWSYWEPVILRALLVETDSAGAAQAWMPTGRDGVGLLRNYMSPSSVSAPRPDQTGQYVGMTISFNVEFDWRL